MYILDTHVACWAALEADKLVPETRQVIEQALINDDLYMANISSLGNCHADSKATPYCNTSLARVD
ncbi:MAG: hypothetical protein ACRYGR_01425 [Janthinobacterium lividum]